MGILSIQKKQSGITEQKSRYTKKAKRTIAAIRKRGVPIAEGHGKNIWDLAPDLEQQIKTLYEDAKLSLWTEMDNSFVNSISQSLPIVSQSEDRKDYVYHPASGEALSNSARRKLNKLKQKWGSNIPDVQIIISDGLNARAIMDDGHLKPFMFELIKSLNESGYSVSSDNIVITHGRVRTGYACGEILFGAKDNTAVSKGIVHIIGERPGSGHHNFSAYITAARQSIWHKKGKSRP